jgi:RNA polymerase sigma-70 factor (ECF subfamily)
VPYPLDLALLHLKPPVGGFSFCLFSRRGAILILERLAQPFRRERVFMSDSRPQDSQGEDQSDAALVERAKTDPEAFGVLYERYVGKVYSYIYYRMGNQVEAEDLTAKTFYRALRRIRYYENRGLPFSAWLYRIAHNLVANWHRDHGRRQMIPLEELYALSMGEHPEHAAEKREKTRVLLGVINKLPPERQQLLILKFGERLSNSEIGAIMGRSEGAIKSLYHRTLLSLREYYGQIEGGGPLSHAGE